MSEYRESPASKVMSEAIDLAIAEESPYPEQALFLNADVPFVHREMERAARDGYSVVLVSPDGDIQIIAPEEILGDEPASEAPAVLSPARRRGR
jgi:hypothetical protein